MQLQSQLQRQADALSVQHKLHRLFILLLFYLNFDAEFS
jgi:hypothetical protein